MPELTHLKALVTILRFRLSRLHEGQDGYSTEAAIVIALIALAALGLTVAVAAAIRRHVNQINGI